MLKGMDGYDDYQRNLRKIGQQPPACPSCDNLISDHDDAGCKIKGCKCKLSAPKAEIHAKVLKWDREAADQEQKHCTAQCSVCGETFNNDSKNIRIQQNIKTGKWACVDCAIDESEQPKPEMPLIPTPFRNGGVWQEATKAQRDADMAWHKEQCKECLASIHVGVTSSEAHDAAIAAQARREFAEKLIPFACLRCNFASKKTDCHFAVAEGNCILAHIRAEGGIE